MTHALRDKLAEEYAKSNVIFEYEYLNDVAAFIAGYSAHEKLAEGLVEAALRFAKIEADCGDDFEGVHEDVILRVEITAGDLHAIRLALSRYNKEEE